MIVKATLLVDVDFNIIKRGMIFYGYQRIGN